MEQPASRQYSAIISNKIIKFHPMPVYFNFSWCLSMANGKFKNFNIFEENFLVAEGEEEGEELNLYYGWLVENKMMPWSY